MDIDVEIYRTAHRDDVGDVFGMVSVAGHFGSGDHRRVHAVDPVGGQRKTAAIGQGYLFTNGDLFTVAGVFRHRHDHGHHWVRPFSAARDTCGNGDFVCVLICRAAHD